MKCIYVYKDIQHCVCTEQTKPSQGRKRPRGAATENSREKGETLTEELLKLDWYQKCDENHDTHVDPMQFLLAKKPTSTRGTGMSGIYFTSSAASAGACLSPSLSKISAMLWTTQKREISLPCLAGEAEAASAGMARSHSAKSCGASGEVPNTVQHSRELCCWLRYRQDFAPRPENWSVLLISSCAQVCPCSAEH